MAVMLTDRTAGDRNGCSCCVKFPMVKGKQKLRRWIRRTERAAIRKVYNLKR